MRAFEDARRPGHPGRGEPRRKEPGMRRPARMQRLYRGALVHELHEAACLAPGDAQRVRHLR